MQMCKYANVQVCKCASMQMYNYANVQVCECASLKHAIVSVSTKYKCVSVLQFEHATYGDQPCLSINLFTQLNRTQTVRAKKKFSALNMTRCKIAWNLLFTDFVIALVCLSYCLSLLYFSPSFTSLPGIPPCVLWSVYLSVNLSKSILLIRSHTLCTCFWWQWNKGDLPIRRIMNFNRKWLNQKMRKIRCIRNDLGSVWFFSKYKILPHFQYL